MIDKLFSVTAPQSKERKDLASFICQFTLFCHFERSEKSLSVWFIRFLVVSLLEMTMKSVNYFLSVIKDAKDFSDLTPCSTLLALHSSLYTLPSTLFPLCSSLYTLPSMLFPLCSSLYALPSMLFPLCSSLYALRSMLFALIKAHKNFTVLIENFLR